MIMLRTPLARMAVEAMQAGLRGEKMPDFGRLTSDRLMVISSIYEEARKERATHAKAGYKP